MTITARVYPFRLLAAGVALLATDLLLPGPAVIGPSPAQAVVGRPLTPVSYAGVARRTTRRTVAATSMAYAAPPPPPTTVIVQQAPPPPPQ